MTTKSITRRKPTAKQRRAMQARETALLAIRNAKIPSDDKFSDELVIYEVVTETGRILHRHTEQSSALAYAKARNSCDWLDEPEVRCVVRVRLGSLLPLRVEGGAL